MVTPERAIERSDGSLGHQGLPAKQGVSVRPPQLPRDIELTSAPVGPLGVLRLGLKRLALDLIDTGLVGVPALRTHVVICGFVRSGSTLLQVMVESCVRGVKGFPRETRGLTMARSALRHHPVMITKRPADIFWMDEIRTFYAGRRPRVRFIVTIRDPRAMLTSMHPRTREQGYHVLRPKGWRDYTFEHYRYAIRFDDTAVVRYEQLVTDPMGVQRSLTEFIGWTVDHPFDRYHERARVPGWSAEVMNGFRPLDQTGVDKWRHPQHRDRIRQILDEVPDFPQVLIEMGYESDTRWTREYV
jgi:hypothetical protein